MLIIMSIHVERLINHEQQTKKEPSLSDVLISFIDFNKKKPKKKKLRDYEKMSTYIYFTQKTKEQKKTRRTLQSILEFFLIKRGVH